jgi:hypothetical protein
VVILEGTKRRLWSQTCCQIGIGFMKLVFQFILVFRLVAGSPKACKVDANNLHIRL